MLKLKPVEDRRSKGVVEQDHSALPDHRLSRFVQSAITGLVCFWRLVMYAP